MSASHFESHPQPIVTVVIPTMGRPTLRRAVLSASQQTGVSTKVLVVVDGTTDSGSLDLSGVEGNIEILQSQPKSSGGAKRAIGTRAATTPWVAYLDDDDFWLAEKLSRQLRFYESLKPDELPIISCCFRYDFENKKSKSIPSQPYDNGDVAEYLFRKRSLSARRHTLHTSTILISTDLAVKHNWDGSLKRHQDWDFVIRVTQDPKCRLIQVPESLAVVSFGSSESMSRTMDWDASLRWASQYRKVWSDSTYSDFVIGQVLRYALGSGEIKGISSALREIRGLPLPSLEAILLSLTSLLSPKIFLTAIRKTS